MQIADRRPARVGEFVSGLTKATLSLVDYDSRENSDGSTDSAGSVQSVVQCTGTITDCTGDYVSTAPTPTAAGEKEKSLEDDE